MVMLILAVLLAISVVLYRNARIRGGESAAVAALDAINQAQFAFMQTCGQQYYAPTLASLGTPIPGGAAFLSPDLTGGEQVSKSGYELQLSGTEVTDGTQACTGITPVQSYQLTADPRVPGLTGSRYFGTNTTRVIFEDDRTFVGSMPETGAPDHGRELVAVRGR